jgi:hypothetical protein
MTAAAHSLEGTSSSLFSLSGFSHFLEEAQCGKLGFTIITVNMVAMAIFAGHLALGGALAGAVGLGAAVVILPSMALFGPSNYFYYLPKPLQMGVGFAAAWASVKVNLNGAWEGEFADWAHFDDPRLAKGLENFFKEKGIHTVMDCGCGTGFYVKQLQANGLPEVYGCDGNPNTSKLGGDHCLVADLSQPNFLAATSQANKKFDCVMSLEVAEHLPKEHEEAFLNNLIGIAKEDGWIVLSWAQEGQGGLGHVNEQNEDYVLAKMAQKGWTYQRLEADQLRLQTAPHTFWFRDSIYVFRRPANNG